MRTVKFGALAIALLAVAVFTSVVRSQDKKPDGHTPGADAQAQMQAQWEAYAKPGPQHKQLEQHFAGTWNTEVRMVMPPEVSTGTTVNQMALDGRYLVGKFDGTSMGKPFQGMGLTGYDNAKKKYFGTWVDTMGTGLMTTEGTYDPASRTYTFEGDMTMPDGNTTHVRELIKVESNDKHSFEMFMAGPDGKEMKVFEIVYTRKK